MREKRLRLCTLNISNRNCILYYQMKYKMHLLYRMYVLKIYLYIYSEIMNNCKSINFIEEILFEMELSVFESTLRRSIF